ncbi:MAG TPA: hypothetical protein VGM68_03110 [Rhizomicrobium sp.]|jgi:hypothetical protein
MRKINSLALSLVFTLAAFGAKAQTMPPTTQELQQRHDQTMRNETNMLRQNQAQSIQQNPPQPQPIITPSGRVIAHPPGHIATPGPAGTEPGR